MANVTSGRTLTQSIATYSQNWQPLNIASVAGSKNGDSALLEKIVSLLQEAFSQMSAGQYQNAILQFNAAESLIYSHIDPQWNPQLGSLLGISLPRDPSLFDSLLSATSQWLNVLPVPTPTSPVRPLIQPPVQLPSAMTKLDGAGLGPVSANQTATAEAIADIRLASIYATQGNMAASAVASARAQTEDQATVSGLKTVTGLSNVAVDTKTAQAVATKPVASAAATTGASPTLTADTPASVLTDVPASILTQRQVGIVTGAKPNYSITSLQWPASGAPDINSIKSYLYEPHASATSLPDAVMMGGDLWQHSLNLSYYYYFAIPLYKAQCYQALGDYQNAISEYFVAAQYAYINAAIEGPYIWVQVANCYLCWGDVYYQQGDTADALTQYSNVLQFNSTTPPSTQLYTTSSLATAVNIAKTLIPQLPTLTESGISTLSSDDTLIATVLLQIYGRLTQLNASLDFSGNSPQSVPIWTFDYLQQVATNLAQLAQQVEQQVINFWSQAQTATLTESQLKGQLAQANSQVTASGAAVTAAQAQATAYQQALTLAQTRASDAKANASEYQSENSQTLLDQAEASYLPVENPFDSGGIPDQPYSFLPGSTSDSSFFATSGSTMVQDIMGAYDAGNRSWSQLQGQLPVAYQWMAGTASQQYQVDSMNRTTTEMQQAATQAQGQLAAANAQVAAAKANLAVAQLQANAAQQNLAAFDASTFTPQVWTAMGNFMMQIYQNYMTQAIAVAKLMQQAYNFENDTSLSYIQSSYPGVVQGLLGADALMSDIQQFTYELVTGTTSKLQLIKSSISLATNYGYLFNTQLIPTGSMSFETSLDDFDSEYPGVYQARLKSVSIDIQGIIPPTGVSGSLTNGGISWYRLPSDIATDSNTTKLRIQTSDTLVISDYNPSQDGILTSTDGSQQLGIFEGAGVASTWTLSLPPSLNDINYSSLSDVVLTFLYEARFDAQLVPTVLADLASRPGFYSRERAIPLAWLYPDLFYAFQSSGVLTLSLGTADFPQNQTNPMVTAVSLVLTSPTASALNGVTISLATPGKTAASAATGTGGSISSQTNTALAGLTGGSALGNWVITISATNNPSLVSNGQLNLSAFTNMALIFDYTFTPRTSPTPQS
jgi:tetratricopeptide (TPR) repeat protein